MRGRLPTYVPPRWYPLGAERSVGVRPEVGSVVALYRGVWRVISVEVLPREKWTPEDVQRLSGYTARQAQARDNALPFNIDLEHLGGVLPKVLADAGATGGVMTFRAGAFPEWWTYPHGRWAKCSCCGEPMPCRAELTDLKVDAAVERLEDFASRMPGTCWGCGEVITRRQKTVRYVGENLDTPTGPEAVFHIRHSCHYLATKYEERWLAADPSRRRILTYPVCRGTLHWYPDGSNDCQNGEPDCRGWETHDHGSQSWLYGAHARIPRRPDYRDPDLPQGRPGHSRYGDGLLDLGDPGDGREECPGTLVVHLDGTAECKAGGRDDCWDGSKYHHRHQKSCRDLSHGCPTCETTDGLA